MKMRIGIFGGSFNPPHKMHKDIAMELMERDYLDKVIYVPTGNNYKKPDLLPGKDRIEMLKLMFQNDQNIMISDFEVKGSLYTINTLNHFHTQYPEDEIYFICGTDNLEVFYTWKNYEEILKKYKLLVIARKNNVFHDIIKKYFKYRKNIILAEIESKDISSTAIRKEIIENGFSDSLKEHLDENVFEYLKKKLDIEVWKNI